MQQIVQRGLLMDDSLLSEEVLWKWMNENLDSWSTKTVTSAVVKFSITIKTHASIWGGGTICSNPLLEEIKRRRHVMLDGHTPCATHAICDGDAASLAIDTSKRSQQSLVALSAFAAATV